MAGDPAETYEFGPFSLDPAEHVLRQDGRVVPLRPKDLDLLLALVQNSGRLLKKDELLTRVWPDSFVEEANLAQHVFTLRKVLGDDKEASRYIETVPRRGYRFIADVTVHPDPRGPALVVRADDIPSPGVSPPSGLEGPAVGISGAAAAAATGAAAGRPTRWSGALRNPVLLILVAAAVLALVLTTTIYSRLHGARSGVVAPRRHVMAVLPFKAVVPGQRDEALELGMADTLITKLGSIRDLITRPIGAVRQYTSPTQDPLEAGRALGVDSVLDGSIQRSGDRIRVTVRLLRIEDGSTLWAGQFDEPFTDIFAVQDAISDQVAQALPLRISVDEKRRLAKRYTNNVAAYELYVKGRFFWNKRTDEGMRTAIEYFSQAVAMAPDYALAYSGLADTYALLSTVVGVAPSDTFPRARVAAERALALADPMAEAHTSLAFVKEAFDWDWAAAEREYRRALELDPNYASAHHRYGVFLCMMARCDEGLLHLEQARQLDPTSMIINADAGLGYYIARRYDDAIGQLRKAQELDPTSVRPRFYLVDCLALSGMFTAAIEEARRASELTGGRAASALAFSYAAAGKPAEALEILRRFEAEAQKAYVSPLAPAAAYTALGDYDAAFRWLEEGIDRRAYVTVRVLTDPRFDALRSQSRYGHLLRRLGLPQ